jgi:hypothetical protein
MARAQAKSTLKPTAASPRQSPEQKVSLALFAAAKHARKQLEQAGLKLPTQSWKGGAVRNSLRQK